MATRVGKESGAQWCGRAEVAGDGVRSCDWVGCDDQGLYRAPWSRDELRRYRWFCLEHVRSYNRSWNYYQGMNEEQVEADLRRDTVWGRPSWPLGSCEYGPHVGSARFRDAFGFFEDGPRVAPKRPETAEERAMASLQLTAPVTAADVKARYKQLVKLHHPDANGGDKAAEEKFKEISEAYRIVMGSLTR